MSTPREDEALKRSGTPGEAAGADLAGRLAEAESRLAAMLAERHRTADRVRRLQSLTSGLLRALTPAQVAEVVVREGLPAVQAEAGALVVVSWEDRKVRLVDARGFPEARVEGWREVDLDLDTPITMSIRAGAPVWIPDAATRERSYPELARHYPEPMYASWAVLPLSVRDRPLGALAVCFSTPGDRPEEERTFMMLIAQQCAQALERARLYDAERRARVSAEFAERRVAFLAEASAGLAASLDHRATLSNVAQLIVPHFADWVVLRAGRPGGAADIVVTTHRDAALGDRLQRWEESHAPVRGDGSAAAAARFEGRSELVAEMSAEDAEREARDAEQLDLLLALETRSRLTVPVRVRNQVFGAIVFGAGTGRRYTPTDIALAEELAARIGQATENAALYEDALAASQSKSNFLAVMSHELRTPLNAILGYADLIMMGVPEPVGQRTQHQVERVRASAVRLLRLVEEVLSFARLEANADVIRAEAVPIADLIGDTQSLLEPIASAKGLSLSFDAEDPALILHTDGWKLRHILSNLVSNAVKFTDRGSVVVRVRADGAWVTFDVIDTGIGIQSEYFERIFDPFWQVEQSATRRFDGSGLGLGVARALAQLLGGDITVWSTPGKGTTFRVRIPIEHPAAATSRSA